jgi:low affinity Fe/Cu permease
MERIVNSLITVIGRMRMELLSDVMIVPGQVSVIDSINSTIAEVIGSLPTIVGALLVLLVGYIIGRILGGIVTRVVRGIGLRTYAKDTVVEEAGPSGGDGLARAIGKIVSYYIYFVAILAAVDLLGIEELSTLLGDIGRFLPVLLGALLVLIIGFIIGRIVGDAVGDAVGGFGIGAYLTDTPLERFGDKEGEFGGLVGTFVTYYIYLLTLVAVADIVQIEALSSLLNAFAGYLPALIGGLVVLLVGIWIAERAGRLVSGSDESRIMDLAGLAVKVVIYYITITIALDTIGFETTVLTNLFTTFVVAFFGALALALAIGIGVAVGLGGQDYVRENIGSWVGSAQESVIDESEDEGEDGMSGT